MSQPHYAEYVPSPALRTLQAINDDEPFTPEPLPPNIPAGPGAKRLLDLGAGDCRFPVGDDDGHLQLFCGEPQDGRSSYCAACGRRSHQTRKLSKITVPN